MAGDISPRTAPIGDQHDNISAALWRRYDEIKNSQSTNNALIEVDLASQATASFKTLIY